MDDLTQYLYEFLMERRMGYLWEDAEYRACVSGTASQEERVRSCLSGEQQKELDRLLDRIAEQDRVEKEHVFRGALALVRELNTSMRA